MPLQLLSRPDTTDTIRSRSPSPLATPASKPQIPTIRLTTATPCDASQTDDASQVAPWITPTPIAPRPNGGTSRKRLVPKKSKLGLLGLSASSAKAREQDFSDVVRRVGGASVQNGSNGFEIYVDPANDPDIGEILMVKKRKSRLALDGLQWGTLGEVTNVSSVPKPKEKGGKKESLLKMKMDENQKWWSIGRGRKDSKEKDKGKDTDRAKSPQPSDKPTDARARFNSLDSGILLTSPLYDHHPKSPMEHPHIPTPPSATPAPPDAAGSGGGKDSVAIRAMRSVRSLARIGSWAQLKNTPNPDAVVAAAAPVKDKESDGKKKKKKEKVTEKEKEKDKNKNKAKETIRYSGSSFEAGALTASPAASKDETKSLGKKKASILGLGWPSTVRLPSSRSGSTASSIVVANNANHRLSVDSSNLLGGGILARARSGSTMSTTSSLRPTSAKSCISRESSGSSGAASVRWDEAGLQTAKEIRRKEKEARSKEKAREKEESKEKRKSKKSKTSEDSTRKSSDSRKRTPLSAIFPGIASEREDGTEHQPATPTVGVYEHEQHRAEVGNSPMETPVKRARPRPVSEQPLDRTQPQAFYEGDGDNVVMSLLDAATNDLAQLINRLDLEATPGSVEMTPISQRSPFVPDPAANSPPNVRLTTESPVKAPRRKNSSMTSLRPYAQSSSKNTGVQLGQNIAPWSTLNAGISPSKPSPSTIKIHVQDNMATLRTHRRTMTPAPAADPSPVFKALRPATTRLMSKTVVGASSGISPFIVNPVDRSMSSLTFGSGHSTSESRGSLSASPVFKKAHGSTRKKSSLVPRAELDSGSLPILPEVRCALGLAGTVGSIPQQVYDGSDPNSDIPDELQVILSNSDQEGEDTISLDRRSARPPLPSPGLPPETPLPVLDTASTRSSLAELPVFRATVIDEDEHHADVEEAGTLSEDDTKRSFDFTGELQKLNESGASDRRSFIEQLENAFRTPAKIDLRYDFEDLPPVPKLPTLQDELSRAGEHSFSLPIDYESRELLPSGFPIDVNAEPSLLPGSDCFATTASDEELLDVVAPQVLRNATTVASQPSNGQLNRDFKFGGKHSSSSKKEASPLTLSDIIPPPEVVRSLSMVSFAGDESSLMKSILAHAIQIESPPERPRLDSNSPSKREAREAARKSFVVASHQRNSSALSFAGFDSFAEIRRGFEFHDSRPGFYPLPATMSAGQQRKHESIQSIASVSSYGNVLHGGSADPFDYGSLARLPSLRERPSSDNFSFTMSTSVDDTFSFIRRPPPRCRVDSDASSFYFRTSLVHPYNRSNRRPESGVSVGPRISLFNRNSTCHRRGDSNTSIISTAQSYANCRRFSWTRHRSNFSIESVVSDFTGTHLERPNLGDKMLESAQERVSPLASISASPPPSLAGSTLGERIYLEEDCDNRASYDSIMDSQYESQKTDSLFEKTGHRNSVCSSDSTFFEERPGNDAVKLPRYRPISSISIPSVHSPPKEDDTMISMLGGGRVRRRSVTSMIGASPCIQVERRKNIVASPPETVFSRIKNAHPEDYESREISRVIESKPSIASTSSSFKFGDERMIRAKHGLLERQSLEDNALMGDGEDLSGSFQMPVFTRPSCANRSRSSTCTSSSGADTPPLSISDGYSSFSEGSLSSIDLSQLNTLLSKATRQLSNVALDRARPRAQGHRRRISQARASRTSVYETIDEELTSSFLSKSLAQQSIQPPASNTPKPAETVLKTLHPSPVFIPDPETSSVDSFSLWDDERGITALRRYYALRDEADDAVTDSKRTWLDTPFSLFAVQSFEPPRHPAGIQAMLQHSLRNYGSLPSDLRPRRARSRVNSRPSPYPRTVKTSFTSSPSAENLRATVAASLATSVDNVAPRHLSPLSNPLQQILVNPNVPSAVPVESKQRVISPDKSERVFRPPPRPRLGSATRRAALGCSKKSTSRGGIENKENNIAISNIGIGSQATVNVSQGTIISPVDGLRLNRPRPRGRPTPASVRPIRG
ncbi:hypothetical protein L210DRAFT_3489659 [Boletus edulis BED1]|uniref:Uncharacterized protein n=1 Tax=Boletus edulis BED1 TaxID=1328754 RepID=A0AAD4BEI3_BOLED|nr:hypothetical protein L210DRAFT_3489659 [Boletus edulis BED1]